MHVPMMELCALDGLWTQGGGAVLIQRKTYIARYFVWSLPPRNSHQATSCVLATDMQIVLSRIDTYLRQEPTQAR